MYKQEIIREMQKYFDQDIKRINHALQVTEYAEELIVNIDNDQINRDVIIYAAILHDIGIITAEQKYGSGQGKYQEIEGPPIARKILSKYPLNNLIIDEICTIIAHHHTPGKINTINFKILYDADWLVNLPDVYNLNDIKKLEDIINKLYLTRSGKNLARKLFLNNTPE